MPKPSAPRRAMAWPMRPMPRMPSVAPCTSLPANMSWLHFVQRPARRKCSLSVMRRAVAIISAKPKSAVVSVSTSGALVHEHAARGARRHVEVVVAHRHQAHRAQLRVGVEQRRADTARPRCRARRPCRAAAATAPARSIRHRRDWSRPRSARASAPPPRGTPRGRPGSWWRFIACAQRVAGTWSRPGRCRAACCPDGSR